MPLRAGSIPAALSGESQRPSWASEYRGQFCLHRCSVASTSVPTVPHLGVFARAVWVDIPVFLAGWQLDTSRLNFGFESCQQAT